MTSRVKSVIVLLSGGLDSAMLLHYYLKKGVRVAAVTVDYGQPWSEELRASDLVAHYFKVPRFFVKAKEALGPPALMLESGSFIPMRNSFLLSIAVNRASIAKFDVVAIGSNISEFSDQTPEFVDRYNFMLDMCFNKASHPWVEAPFSNWTKDRVFKYAMKSSLPLDLIVSCPTSSPCGVCATCKLRLKYGV